VSVIETAPGPGAGPRLHAYDFDEALYVLEGTLVFQLGDELVQAGPGDLVFARMAADRRGAEPPAWAMQPIPEVTALGPPFDPGAVRRGPVRRLPGAARPAA